MTTAVPPRGEVLAAHTWDAASVFPSDEAWEAAITDLSQQLPALGAFRGRLHEGPAMVALWMDAREAALRSATRIYLYAELFYNVDTADQAALAKQDRALGIYTRTQAALAFGEPELIAVGFDTLRRWAQSDGRLRVFGHYFDTLERQHAHIRSAEVEELLGQAMEPFASATNIHAILADADLRFEPAVGAGGEPLEIAQGNMGALLTSPEREVRRTAWEHYADAHLAVKNTMATCLATGVKQSVFMARARRYGSALEAALSANFIPVEVFHSLIAAFRANLPTWHRYWRLRRRALGYERLHVYDVKAPLTRGPVQVPFDKAMDWIADGMRPLGEDYVGALLRGVREQRWVDIYPNRGKRMGAFSTGVQGTHPFILMNYNDDLFSMSTLAHELGHSLHSYYTWQTQPHIYSDYSIFVAEVASNFNQAMVRDYLLRQNDDADFQIGLIEEAMSNFHRYFFVMPTLARFELEIHERVERGEGLTADSMIALMADLFREGYGEEVAVDEGRVGSTWCQFSTHLYANFYVYQYATGIAAAHALAERVLAGAPGAVDRYLSFLRAGSSVYPLDALRLAGVDMTSPEPVDRAFGVLARYVERLEGLLAGAGH